MLSVNDGKNVVPQISVLGIFLACSKILYIFNLIVRTET